MHAWDLVQRARTWPTAIVLVLFNLLPLAGVLWWGWQLQTILVLYWLESGVIGLLNVPRMLLAAAPLQDAVPGAPAPPPPGPFARLALAVFFVVHYGGFWIGHGVFVFLLPLFGSLFGGAIRGERPSGPGFDPFQPPPTSVPAASGDPLLPGILALAAVHVISFLYYDLYLGESRRRSVRRQMMAPYARVIVLHVTILGGAFLVALTGRAIAALALLVLLKTVIDLATHLATHRDAVRDPAETIAGTRAQPG